jgi:hypothetical protein
MEKNDILPYHKATGHPADLSRLRTFGCRINALSTTPRDGKVSTENIIQGHLLGYGGSMKKNILLNEATGKICRSIHATFDEAQLSTPVEDRSPNSLALWGALQRSPNAPPPSTTDVITPP